MTSPADQPAANSAFAGAGFSEPYLAAQEQWQTMRETLKWRIHTYTHPSRLINRIGTADQRCGESTRELASLIRRSPRILEVIRAELREVFELDPDSLLFTEAQAPGVAPKVNSLTDRALLALVRASVSVNINQFTTLSVKGEPSRCLPYTPLQALRRVLDLNLFERLNRAATDYWNTLVDGSWLTRKERWVELHTQLFADRAFIACQLNELSSAAMAMIQALIDAPTEDARRHAGGDWASVQVRQLMWPGSTSVAIPGALHLHREDDPDGAPHVIYLPGVVRNFYEYPSFTLLQCAVVALVGGPLLSELWQCLPLKRRHELCRPADLTPAALVVRGRKIAGDGLAQSAQALLDGQWENELDCAVQINHAHVFSEERPRPPPLDAVPFLAYIERARRRLVGKARLGKLRNELLDWDRQRRSADVIFASTAPGLALRTAEQQIHRYETAVAALLNRADASVDSQAYTDLVALVSQREAHAQALSTLMQDAPQRAFDLKYWAERPKGSGTPRRVNLYMNAQNEALRCETLVLQRLKLLSPAHRDLVTEVVDQPLAARRGDSTTRVLSIAVGNEPDAFYPLHNVWVVTTAEALRVPTRQAPVVLYAFGQAGGVLAFAGLDALTQRLKTSLSSRDDCVLWGGVEHDKRRDLRAHALRGTLAVRYLTIRGKPALAALRKLLSTYHRLKHSTEDITRIFSEVQDTELSRSLLMADLIAQLQVPGNDALSQAQANIALLRKAAAAAKRLPTWVARATRAQRKAFRRLEGLFLGSAVAFESRLEQQLPDLETFARRVLIARLNQDGFYPHLDIDAPLIDMPDDVNSRFCGWESGCAIGDRGEILTPTRQRSTFSLLQLALHNLDAEATPTRWRLQHARYLQPDWQQRLNADYLIAMVSSLDVGGQYDALIQKTFYPSAATERGLSEGRIPELLNRAVQAGFNRHVFWAVQQGLSAEAQRIFSTAVAARTAQGLLENALQLQLCGVHLVGHTMLHDRYVAGIVVVHDKGSGHCLIYWPDAPSALALTEYSSLQQAHEALNQISALHDNVQAIARQVAPGWAFDVMPFLVDLAIERAHIANVLPRKSVIYLVAGAWRGAEFARSFAIKHLEPTPLLNEIEKQVREQIACDPLNWLAIVPTSCSDAQALLYRSHVLDLQRRTQAASNSGKALEHYRLMRLKDQDEARRRGLESFFSRFLFPPLALYNDVTELLLAARRYHRYGDSRDAVDVGFMSTLLAVDVLLALIPAAKKTGTAGLRIVRPAARNVLARIHRLRLAAQTRSARLVASPLSQLKALEHFRVKGVPEGAVALKGPGDKGVYVKDGEQFLADDSHHYPVYRRQGEGFFRLKNKQAAGENELIVDIYQPKEWLLGADAPQPVAGTSSGVLNPWRGPAHLTDWQPPLRSATENSIFQSPAPGTYWFDWNARVPAGQPSSSSPLGTFHVHMDFPGFPYDTIYMGPTYDTPSASGIGYYRLLPQGDNAPWSGIGFITRDEPIVSRVGVDIERWTSTALGEQPIPVSRLPTGEWQLHKPLFDRPLERYVDMAFPTLTSNSRHRVVARLIELADSSRSVTATHLLNIRATLDGWLAPSSMLVGQTDDLLRMLQPIDSGATTLYIGYEVRPGNFRRVDFQIDGLERRLLAGGSAVTAQRMTAQNTAISRVLDQLGFDVNQVTVQRGRMRIAEFIATHPNSDKVYYITPQWADSGTLAMNTRLTDRWLEHGIKQLADSAAMHKVKRAKGTPQLVRMLAGIQWPPKSRINPRQPTSPSVYFVKVNPPAP